MTKKHKNEKHEHYNKYFKETFYVGILNDDNIVIDSRRYEKTKDLKQYLTELLGKHQDCVEKVRNLLKSEKVKDTSKIFLLECQNIKILIAMRLDVMIKPFENMKEVEINRLERIR